MIASTVLKYSISAQTLYIIYVKMFCTNIESCVNNNGSASDYFRQERVRQGDPLAPYLFLLAIETLAIVIHENKEIKGIKIEQEETTLLPSPNSHIIKKVNHIVYSYGMEKTR